jgi:hypothetical protein
MGPQASGICHCEERSDAAIPASGSEDGDRHVASAPRDDIFIQGASAAGRCGTNKTMSPLAPGICHCEERSDAAIPASESEDGDRHVATLPRDDIFIQGRVGRRPVLNSQ